MFGILNKGLAPSVNEAFVLNASAFAGLGLQSRALTESALLVVPTPEVPEGTSD